MRAAELILQRRCTRDGGEHLDEIAGRGKGKGFRYRGHRHSLFQQGLGVLYALHGDVFVMLMLQ